MTRRIEAEEKVFNSVNFIVTSTSQEIENHKNSYKNLNDNKFKIIPPGLDLEKFFPYYPNANQNLSTDWNPDLISNELQKFLVDLNKPIILTLCRPDRRKNITGLITAYGEDKYLQKISNLAVYAGIREDIQTMEENEREVLTEILLLMDKYNLYGKIAIPKKHNTEHEVPVLYRYVAATGGVYVNASLSETFGLTLIEAAASGLPVVATKAGGPRDIVNNCNNGEIVDVSNPKNISVAILKILIDKKLWLKYSENGIIKSKEIYSWDAHTKKYLDEIKNIQILKKPVEKSIMDTGRKLFHMKGLIVTDIDNTLLGDEISLNKFNRLLENIRPDIGFAVATGRVINSALEELSKYKIDMPDVLITSVGSEIYYNYGNKITYSKGWEAHISNYWDRDRIVELLSKFSHLKYQENENQKPFKISYYLKDNPNYLKQIKSLLINNRIKCNVIYSHGEFLDILPYRASKGKAIRYLGYRYNIPFERILTAGDSGNDIEMLKGDLLGVVVGNYSPELEILKGSRKIYFSKYNNAAGIIDGIDYYDLINICKESDEN
jgi:sucrose-phosphate synthase